jgi:hypothetical protein
MQPQLKFSSYTTSEAFGPISIRSEFGLECDPIRARVGEPLGRHADHSKRRVFEKRRLERKLLEERRLQRIPFGPVARDLARDSLN